MKLEYQNKFIARLTTATASVKKLTANLKKCFSPSTNTTFKESKNDKLKEYINLASTYKISHYIFLSQTDNGLYIKIMDYHTRKTYTFKLESYTLMNYIHKGFSTNIYTNDPYIYIEKDENMDLEFSNIHIDYKKIERSIHITKKGDKYCFRHYYIKNDEDDRVRLIEMGPRITMELYKVEADIMKGEVLYNKYVQKSEDEALKIKERMLLREKRRKEQEEKVREKKIQEAKAAYYEKKTSRGENK